MLPLYVLLKKRSSPLVALLYAITLVLIITALFKANRVRDRELIIALLSHFEEDFVRLSAFLFRLLLHGERLDLVEVSVAQLHELLGSRCGLLCPHSPFYQNGGLFLTERCI